LTESLQVMFKAIAGRSFGFYDPIVSIVISPLKALNLHRLKPA
jgi:hypothetical protein